MLQTPDPAMPPARPDETPPRQGLWYGWVVLAVIFAVMSVIVGMRNSLGFFFKTVSGEFGWTPAETAGAYSIGMLMQAFCSPLFGALGERWSLRWMIAGGVCVAGAAFLMGPFLGGLGQF
jgi:MFS family permease